MVVVIGRFIWKKKVGLRLSFGVRATRVPNAKCLEDLLDVILKRVTNAALAPVLDGERERNEFLNLVRREPFLQAITNKVTLQRAEKNLLLLHPCNEHAVWSITWIKRYA